MNLTPRQRCVMICRWRPFWTTSVCVFILLTAFGTRALDILVCAEGGGNDSTNRLTPEMALRKAREIRRVRKDDKDASIHIIFPGGTYHLSQSLRFREEDSGTKSNPLVIEAKDGKPVVLSGGIVVSNWVELKETPYGVPSDVRGVWAAPIPQELENRSPIRQLWINNRKGERSRHPNGDVMDRMIRWDRHAEQAWIPQSSVKLLDMKRLEGLEIFIEQQWEIAMCRISSVTVKGSEACLTFKQPESSIEFAHPWPQPVFSTNGNAAFYLVGAMAFLDTPGEWILDTANSRILYLPLMGEDMKTAIVVAPFLETMVTVNGTLDSPVHDIVFDNLGFEHTSWTRPYESGHVPLQDGMAIIDSYKLSPKGTPYHLKLDNLTWIERMSAAVRVQNANRIVFNGCRFEHLGNSGLDFESGTEKDQVSNSVFHDIGGNGIQWGRFSDTVTETHKPYKPADAREVCHDEVIERNSVSNCGTEDWGCSGILAGFVHDVSISHNDVFDLPYTGISLGWGWQKKESCLRNNKIIGNHVFRVARKLGDTAGIYVLSSQPGTLIAENCVEDIKMSPYVFDPEHWFYLYLDEGSSYITVRDNWCPTERFLKNANGPGNKWINNGPYVSDAIRTNAGASTIAKGILHQ